MVRTIALALIGCLAAQTLLGDPAPVPAHDRPFFMPESRRQEIVDMIQREEWAREEYGRLTQAVLSAHATLGTPQFTRRQHWQQEAFWAAFLYALEGRQEYMEVARAWLLHTYGSDTRLTSRARRTLADPDYWKGGEQEVDWYRLDIEGYVAFDWIYNGLPDEDREYLHTNLRLETEYRMACMDSWGSTPNLNFKPIFMVAFAAMALQDEHIVEWGWRRTARQGNFYSMMDTLLKDGGVWHEAAIYSVAHSGLWCVTTMAFYRSIFEGESWFDAETPSGASARKMMDYFIDTAYPIERTGVGKGRMRVVTYGDGSTSPPRYGGGEHDMFIGGEHPNANRLLTHMRDGLIMAYAASRDDRYAPFIELSPGYSPNLWDHPPLPDEPAYPPAPSKIWPEFGLAMLRSDESPGYYTNPDAMAAFQMMTKPYGHQQPDKFQLNFFGANRLLYPDYLRMQYENRAIGWTYTSASQNTIIVDELDTGTAEPHIRNDFTPEVKYIATSASGVYPDVSQTRALLLTSEYLLDLFHVSSKTPRTYDYVLHSMGLPRPASPQVFETEGNVSEKYWALDNPLKSTVSDQWSLEFVIKEDPPEKPVVGLGDEWFEHEARVRITMASDEPTTICYGTWGAGNYVQRAAEVLAYANAASPVHADMEVAKVHQGAESLGMLVARREGRRDTVFASVHEPYANEQAPRVRSITKVAETDRAVVVRVEAENFIDYAAVVWGEDDGTEAHLLASNDGNVFIFRNYGWLRVPNQGDTVARGGWVAFSLIDGRTTFGDIPAQLPPPHVAAPECPFTVEIDPPVTRMFTVDERTVTLTLQNTLDAAVAGAVEFYLDTGISVTPERPSFGPIEPGDRAEISFRIATSENADEGLKALPYRVVYRLAGADADVITAYHAVNLTIGRSVRPDTSGRYLGQMFEGPEMSARFETSGLTTHLADADGTVRLDGTPLYTVKDLKGILHFGEEKPVAFSIWLGLNVGAASHHVIGSPRINMTFLEDRIGAVRLNRIRTRQEAYVFTVPGQWISPAGPPRWARIVAVDENGEEFDAAPGTNAPIAAAELAFPDGNRSIAFSFDPPMQVQIEGTRMEFVLLRPLPDGPENQWSVGFCRPGELDAWRKR